MARLTDIHEIAIGGRLRSKALVSANPRISTSNASRWGRGRRAKAAGLSVILCALSLPAAAMNVTVHVTNNTSQPITNVSSTFGLPRTIDAWRTETVTPWTGNFSSSVSADNASGKVPGGCLFQAGHEVTSTGPVYSGNGAGYGQVLSPFCFVNVSQRWSPPYDYTVRS